MSGVSELEVRAARPEDHAAMADVYRRASLTNEGDRAALLAHPEVLELSADVVRSGRAVVATLAGDGDGQVVGFASTRPTGDAVLELDDLFVAPEQMRRGVARALIRAIVRQAAAEGVARLEVTGNEHALEFYRAVGFVLDGRADTEFGPGLRMHLDIG